MLSRYIIIFPPRWRHILYRKEAYFVLFIFHIIFNLAAVFIALPMFKFTEVDLYQEPVKLNQQFEHFINFSSFLYMDYRKIKTVLIIGACIMTTSNIAFISLIVLFLYHVNINYKAHYVNNKIQKSLVISAVVQMILTCCLLMLAPYCYIMFICLEIENTGPFLVAALCLNCIHFPVDAIATLYFVSPYRKFFKQWGSERRSAVTPVTGFISAFKSRRSC